MNYQDYMIQSKHTKINYISKYLQYTTGNLNFKNTYIQLHKVQTFRGKVDKRYIWKTTEYY